MSSVTFPTAIGGDGSTVTDDDNATTGLRNGGWRTRFIPCFTNLVNIADYVVTYTASTTAFATPPPMGSTTPNTGAFTRVTVTGSTAPANGIYLPGANILGFATNSSERVRIDSSGNVGIGTTSPAQALDVQKTQGWVTTTSTTGTNSSLFKATNTGGSSYFGRDNSTGSVFGSSAYSTVVYGAGAYPMSFFTNDALRMTLDSSGNLGLGVTPSGWVDDKAFQLPQGSVSSGYEYGISTNANCYRSASNVWKYTTGAGAFRANVNNSGFQWFTSSSGTAGNAISFTQAMTLDASGNLLVGTTSLLDTGCRVNFAQDASNYTALEFQCSNASYTGIGMIMKMNRNTTNGSYKVLDYYNAGAGQDKFYVIDSGAIYSTSTSITGISDVRHKENIRDLETGLSTVLALKPRRFDWKEGKGINRKDQPGFIAQEVEEVLPELVELWTESQEDTNEYKGVRLADMIPTLVKAIQEIAAELTELKQRIH